MYTKCRTITCRTILKLSQTQLDALKKLAIADLDAGDPIERVDYGEMYLENLSLLLFGKSCPHRTKDRVYYYGPLDHDS